MKLKLQFDFPLSVRVLLQRCGYHPHHGFGEQESYVRRLSRDFYPRFHVYVEEAVNQLILNLHLDQKRPSYPGAHAHNADYEGDIVAAEARRVSAVIASTVNT